MNFVRQKASILEVCTVAHPTSSEHNTAFSVVDRLCDKREGPLCVHGKMVFQSKDLRPFMGLQNKAVDTVMSNKKEASKQTFSGELKKGKKHHANGITSWPSSSSFLISFS
jgi:hypothetical protein